MRHKDKENPTPKKEEVSAGRDGLAQVFHYDLYGKRDVKYDFLSENSLKSIHFEELPNVAPMYFMVPKDFEAQKNYEQGFSLKSLFSMNSVGIVTGKDSLYIDEDKKHLTEKIKAHYETVEEKLIKTISYRPFDLRYLYNNIKLIERNRFRVMQHFLKRENVGLVTIRRSRSPDMWKEIFVSNVIISGATTISALDINYLFPLYLYTETNVQQTERTPNLNTKIVKQIAETLSLTFTNEKEETQNTFAPIDILDYIYAVLHSPSYREKYKEFLKIDFPRVPYPSDTARFWTLVKLGGEIRQIHLLESSKVEAYITQYPKDGDNQVSNLKYKSGKVYINETQYFDNVPQVAWEFYIGGYQPAQKWLKDRKGRKLSFEEILHYQKIIVVLSETDRLMKEVDKA